MDRDTRRGRSRTQARRNKAMRQTLLTALDELLEESLRAGWYGEIALRAHVEDGIL